MNFKLPKDKARLEYLLFDLFYRTKLIEELPKLLDCNISDDDWGKIIECIERINYRKVALARFYSCGYQKDD